MYAAADVFVLGSRHEAASFALIEALAFGVTPVVSDIPAFRALTAAREVLARPWTQGRRDLSRRRVGAARDAPVDDLEGARRESRVVRLGE